eukprot:TRINITY_DN12713_c0_g1_i2.p1 TRINITY_DN12713_c0_g1~~TRINITY_DN12713_c0_g1_i2.p1  ORF type:complete len:133 (-),score=28.99 TRINITY_DN12713_c0_g1_i2:31-429(-)
MFFYFFFFKQKTAYEIMPSLVGSEMCIRDSICISDHEISGLWCLLFECYHCIIQVLFLLFFSQLHTSCSFTQLNFHLIGYRKMFISVSYTHLTLPTICSVQISVVAVSLKKKKKENTIKNKNSYKQTKDIKV